MSSSSKKKNKSVNIRPGETTPLLFGSGDIHPNNSNNSNSNSNSNNSDNSADSNSDIGIDTDIATSTSTSTTNSNSNSNSSYYYYYYYYYYNLVWDFLDSKTIGGQIYEKFMIILILINVIAFIIGTLFAVNDNDNDNYEEDNNDNEEEVMTCGMICDTIWFGNYNNNKLSFLNIGTTSLLELFTIAIFTVEYILRVWTCPLENQVLYGSGSTGSSSGGSTGGNNNNNNNGNILIGGRMKYIFTNFFSIVDLASTLPFYIDVFLFPTSGNNVIGTTSFLRMFRLFKLIGRVDGGDDSDGDGDGDGDCDSDSDGRRRRRRRRYDSALTLCDDVYRAQKDILCTAAFVGVTTWIVISSLYYIVERRNLNMIYCPNKYCPNLDNGDNNDVDTSLCEIDIWGIVNCTNAGCPSIVTFDDDNNITFNNKQQQQQQPPCWNLYQSIPMSSYYTLLNLFGEYPLFDQHSVGGQIIGTITAIVAVTFFALPVGIIGNGFESEISKRRKRRNENGSSSSSSADADAGPIVERGVFTLGYIAPTTYNTTSFRCKMYNFFFPMTTMAARLFDTYFINILVIGTAITYMIDTIDILPEEYRIFQSYFELFSVVIFSMEYILKFSAVTIDPMYNNNNNNNNSNNNTNNRSSLWSYVTGFLPMVDLLGFLPYWIVLFGFSSGGTSIIDISGPSDVGSTFVKALRLLRIFRFEKYTHAFTSFDDVFTRNYDVLSVTFFSSLLLWVLFSSILYITERNNPDNEMSSNYNNMPNSMWMTLLNLSGEAPLAQYSIWGKIATGILGLFATAIFGIPIGILGAGFEEVVEEETEDDDRETTTTVATSATKTQQREVSWTASTRGGGTDAERWCYNLVNGYGSALSQAIETLVYILIFVAISIGVLQTVKGHENDFSGIEAFTVYAFTLEYIIRFIGVGADPSFSSSSGTTTPGSIMNGFVSRIKYVFSFYSIIDLLAILPYYIALLLPEGLVDQYDEYLRMARIFRLLKLDKYAPSFTLIDDVIRYKWDSLKVAGYAAITLWTVFAGLIYLFEYTDSTNGIDPVPLYGCVDDCMMMDRFRNFFDSFFYTGIHLTGDYPITTYDWPAKFVNFFMVVAAVGVVSIPSGLIASGFVEIVQSKNKSKKNKNTIATTATAGAVEGDDWYEERYRALEGVAPPNSPLGPTVDKYQIAVNEFLNGTKDSDGHTRFTQFAFCGRVFIFTVIIANIVAVMVESIPQIDKAVGNDPGNFFDVFEAFSIAVFTLEYGSRLFCAPKNRESLYSSFIYAQTFFGIVDFLSTAPWYIEEILVGTGTIAAGGVFYFRIFRIFRILQLEDFVTAFSKLDNVFRASTDVLKATGLLALIIWIGGGSMFFILEQNNPNWRQCDASIPLVSDTNSGIPGCYDFASTEECNEYYPGMCDQKVFVNMPNTLYMTAVFLGGEWGITDFTWAGRILCTMFCYIGIALYAIPAGILFDKFGAVLGFDDDDENEDDDDDEEKDE